MANCSSCNGCNGRSCTRVGALGTLCRTGCRYPFYTGPCPSAPCVDHCGNCSSNNCCSGCYGCSYAGVSDCGCSYSNCRSSNNCNNRNTCKGWNTRSCCNCNHCNSCNNCNDCGCNDCCDSCSSCDCDDCDDCDRRRRRNRGRGYGVFSLGGSVHLSVGGAAEFAPRDVNPDYFSCRGDAIVIRRPGLYRAVLTADIPKFTEADTILGLDLNGKRIPAAEMALDAADCASATSYTTDAIFEANAGDKLRMCTANALNVNCGSDRNLFKLTIYRI